MAWAVLGETPDAVAAVAGAARWISTQPDSVRSEPLPWLAVHLADVGVAAITPGGGGPGGDEELVGRFTRRELRGRLYQSTSPGRAALLLHDGCGYTPEAVAALCRRTVPEIVSLLGPDPIRHAPPAREHAARRGRRRRLGVGPLLVVAVLAGAVAVVTHDGGMRPTLADEPPVLDRMDEQLGCGIPPGMPVGTATFLDLELAGGARTTRVYVPPSASPDTPLPVMLLFGDFGSSSTQTSSVTSLEAHAATAGIVVVTPEPVGGELSQWNVAEAPDQPDDIEFVTAALDQLAALLCLDQDRVSVVGLGDGAHLAGLWSCRRSDRTAATVMVAGAYLPASCPLGAPTPLLVLASTDDTVLPPDGGFGPGLDAMSDGGMLLTSASDYEPLSVATTLTRWADAAACDPVASTTTDEAGANRTTYAGCLDDVTVRGTVAPYGLHGWPPNATAEVLSFVAGQTGE